MYKQTDRKIEQLTRETWAHSGPNQKLLRWYKVLEQVLELPIQPSTMYSYIQDASDCTLYTVTYYELVNSLTQDKTQLVHHSLNRSLRIFSNMMISVGIGSACTNGCSGIFCDEYIIGWR